MSAIERLGLALSVGIFCPSQKVDQEQPQEATPGMTTEICTHLARGEAPPRIPAWPQELGQGILAVRRNCAAILEDPNMCPLATSLGVLKTAKVQPGILPDVLIEGAGDLLKETAELGAQEAVQASDNLPKRTRVPDPVR